VEENHTPLCWKVRRDIWLKGIKPLRVISWHRNNSCGWTPHCELTSAEEIVKQLQPTPNGLTAQISKGQRRILVCTPMDKTATFRNAYFTWQSPHPIGDYYRHINQYNHVQWTKRKLIPSLVTYGVAVLDNAAYHNVQLNKLSSQKPQEHKGISYSEKQFPSVMICSNQHVTPLKTFHYQRTHDSHGLANQIYIYIYIYILFWLYSYYK
jgi:hypothetical protein